MATNTYVALDKQVLTGTASSITFSNISQAYTDLELVVNYIDAGAVNHRIVINSDSGTNYSNTTLNGNGSTAASARYSSQSFIYTDYYGGGASSGATMFAHFLNYSNTTTNKTVLIRQNSSAETNAIVGLWRSTAAITSVTVSAPGSNFSAGTTATLYGIASTSAGVKATGGIVYSDANYYYHVFNASGTFTPTSNLTADYLVVAGGGGGMGSIGGGGGAGGLRSTVQATGGGGSLETPLSLTSGTAYTVTVGAGGAGGAGGTFYSGRQSSVGSNSVFSTITSIGGGNSIYSATAGTGGSGGGAFSGSNSLINGGSGTSGQGYAGGSNGGDGPANYGGGGGGGAGAVGSNGGSTAPGNGGAGLALSSWATPTGIGVSSYLAGGGGGGAYSATANFTRATGGAGGGGNGGESLSGTDFYGYPGTANTGGGGGAASRGSNTEASQKAGGNGGSGIVVVRYAKA